MDTKPAILNTPTHQCKVASGIKDYSYKSTGSGVPQEISAELDYVGYGQMHPLGTDKDFYHFWLYTERQS
jgi:hypothetical protein